MTLAFSFAANIAVMADPANPLSAPEESRIPLSERVFDLKKQWRKTKKPEKKWRASRDKAMTLKKGRFKSPPPALYDPREDQDPWEPFSSSSDDSIRTKPPTLFKFRF